jgi:hypothetical protein
MKEKYFRAGDKIRRKIGKGTYRNIKQGQLCTVKKHDINGLSIVECELGKPGYSPESFELVTPAKRKEPTWL